MTEVDYTAAQNEYAQLRIFAPNADGTYTTTTNTTTGTEGTAEDAENDAVPDLSEINPDYIAWIRIDGTDIDYPVVRGPDNFKYLNTTFTGDRNPSGTIFMDSENQNGFDFFAILHGHNMRDGSMFAGLHRFTDNRFRTEHSEVTIYSIDKGVLVYKIFAVKLTNINDAVFDLPLKGFNEKADYFSGFGFSETDLRDSIDILVLATCTVGERNERLLVFAAHVHG